MQEFLEFHHLPSLFKASWQGAVLILLVLAAQLILGRRLNPRWRYGLWLLVLIRLSLPWTIPSPLSVFNYLHLGGGVDRVAAGPPARGSETRAVPPAVARLGASVGGLPPGSPARRSLGAGGTLYAPRSTPAAGLGASDSGLPLRSPARRSLGAGGTLHALLPTPAAGLLWLWSAGAFFLALCLVVSHYRIWKRVTRCRCLVNAPVLNLLEDCKQLMGVRTRVTLVESGALESPSLFGFLRPRLLLPAGLATSFSLDELRYVFLHELGHLKRRDIPTGWVMAALQILHWFNPVVWWGFQRMRADRELACDALALTYAREEENQPYGRTIIKLLEGFGCSAWAPGLAGTVENKNQIRERIEMISKFKKTNRGLAAAMTLFAALSLLTLTDAQNRGNAGAPAKAETPQAGNEWDLQQKLKMAETGNQWAVYDLWDAYYRGHHGMSPDPAQAAKWLRELVQDVWVVRFEPVDDFAPANPAEFLGRIHEYSASRSGRENLGAASFFRTTRQGDKLVGSFLSNYPDQLKASLAKVPGLKVTSLERIAPEEFVKYEASPQESLAAKWDLQHQLKEAEAGNQWAVYDLWDAYYRGHHGISPDPAQAAKWLGELVQDVWVVRFEPVDDFAPTNPAEFLGRIHEYSASRSGRENIGAASFFRTTRQGDKLAGSFLSNYPDRLKASLAKVPGLKVTSLERIAAEEFVKYEESPQESLADKAKFRDTFEKKMAQDRAKYAPEQLRDAEQLYQVANQKWGSPEANESLQKMIKKYPDINRTGCAMLYLAQRSAGDERAKYLRDCIEKFNDCFYGDGVQVGAYARFLLAVDYKSKGEEKRAAELYNEIKAKYTDAIDHGGKLLVSSIKAD